MFTEFKPSIVITGFVASVNVTFAVSVIVLPPMVPDTVTDSITVFVNVAEYVPFPLSVTLLNDAVALSVDSNTGPPLLVKLLPFTSLAWTVIVALAEPSAGRFAGFVTIVVVEPDAGPGRNVTTAVPVIALPAIVPLTVTTSATVLVIVAV